MNAIEIEEAISALFDKPCEPETFPAEFLEAFGNKTTTIKRLQSAASLSDIEGAVLLRNNIHLKVCSEGQVGSVFNQLKTSPTSVKNKVKFILATDGTTVEAEDLSGDAPLVCEYGDFPNHFGYFLPLAGIETVKQIRDSSFDIRATSRLNRLYIELLKDNPVWGTSENRHEMNHFMARLIFCFFAEDTDIFRGNRLFTTTIEQMSDRDSGNTNQIISEVFRALNTANTDRSNQKLPRWTEQFPYVNGGLFAGNVDVPRFSKIARSYLLHIGSLDWTKINPDIFGSMIQAVADDEERGALGMHYTSVPNILKVLNPLFLDDLREQVQIAGDNARMLLNLRKRISKIRVFDPACGSGNFLVIAYKQMREIESEINLLRNEPGRKTDIPLTNFRGIELRDFPAEIARLALIIAEYQCDLLYRGQKEALDDFLPLDSKNWITCGNALRLDWLSLCPPTGTSTRIQSDDLFDAPIDQAQIDFENEGGETYICGNPPYAGKGKKEDNVLSDMNYILEPVSSSYGYIDFAGCWFIKASEYLNYSKGLAAFVSTNSLCQGQQVPQLWPLVIKNDIQIQFAHQSFKWSNNAANNAGVICVIIAIGKNGLCKKRMFDGVNEISVSNITPYLTSGKTIYIKRESEVSFGDREEMQTGSVLNDGGNLILSLMECQNLTKHHPEAKKYIHKIIGAQEFLSGQDRYCLMINDSELSQAIKIPEIKDRLALVTLERGKSKKKNTRDFLSQTPHKFEFISGKGAKTSIIIPTVSSGRRKYLPVGLLSEDLVIAPNYALYDSPIYNFSILSSKLHILWVGAVCGRLKSDYRYSNTLGWNIFPFPALTEKNKLDLARCAEEILLAREVHFPATVADLYEPDSMPKNLREAHDQNDEILERIYIGRRFKNDTERLEKLFELYTKMTSKK